MKDPLMQTLHSPAGADAFFALGLCNHGGGFALEEERAPEQDVFIGVRDGNDIRCLPFFKDAAASQMDSFVQRDNETMRHRLTAYAQEEVERTLGQGVDAFSAGPVTFELFAPPRAVPDPSQADGQETKDAIVPAIIARMTVDNRAGDHAVEGLFGVSVLRGLTQLSRQTQGKCKGFTSYAGYGFAVASEEDVEEFVDFGLVRACDRPQKVVLWVADMAGLAFPVPAGQKREITLAFGWFREGNVVQGAHRGTYYYTKYFTGLEDVLGYALLRADAWQEAARHSDAQLDGLSLSPERRLMLCQASWCYYASTMLFEIDHAPRWLVNEGSFRMISTLDLVVDHAFFELRQHPWVLRNQLDSFLAEYSYTDQCGLTFAHDQGTHHVFSPFGHSSYEIPNLDDCFSYMSQEQLCNWVLSSALYAVKTGDVAWARGKAEALCRCLDSLRSRDSLEGTYSGLMNIDSDRCGQGAEITTYDSLDTSLGQARQNLYVGVKRWATSLALERLLTLAGCEAHSSAAKEYALLCANAIAAAFDPEGPGFLPAILDGGTPTAIIPAIEALVYPHALGMGDALDENGVYGALLRALKRHTLHVVQPGMCLFPDGGWKLSAGSDNSWISKIFLCEYVAQTILGLDFDYEACDRAHAHWWFEGCKTNPGIDQIIAGTSDECGFHYPRCVTNTLWLGM